MTDESRFFKWHLMSEISARAASAITEAPDQVFRIPLSELPAGIQQMPGLTEAYVSHYVTPQVAPGAVSALGEFAAIRTESVTCKAYNFVFGVSSDSNVYFAGPFTNIPAHHFETAQPIPISSLFFGHPRRGGG